NKLKMSKRKQQQIEEVNEETSNKHQKIEQVSEKTYKFYLKQKKWELTKDVKEKALNIAFSNKNECLEFMKNLFCYYEAITSEFNKIENIISLDRKHEYYVKMQMWKKEKLNWALNDANRNVSNLEKLIKKLEKEKKLY
ncbi:3669_t:CDS:1, partial [Cetraspora pellucida]